MTRVTFGLDGTLTEQQRRALELLDQVHAVSPATALWLRNGRVGPRPDTRRDEREIVDALLRGLELL